jgi:hypothetical protein
MSRLITASLHGQIKWFQTCPESWKGRAFTSLTKSLAREWSEPNAAGQRGIDFENEIYRLLRVKRTGGSKKFQEILKHVEGAQFQKKVKTFMMIDDVEYCLYCKLDAWFPDMIIDIKTTGSWDGYSEQKYLGSFQHKLYCYVAKVPDFEYLIAIFDGDESEIKDVKRLPYHVDSFDELELEVRDQVKWIVNFLKDHPDLEQLYNDKFCLY